MQTFGRPTVTEDDQQDVEDILRKYLESEVEPQLKRRHHQAFLANNLSMMPEGIQSLHCSRPWLCYWILHAADMLGVTRELFARVPAAAIAELLFKCFSVDDPLHEFSEAKQAQNELPPHLRNQKRAGFGGGPNQVPHVATTYAAVNALCIIGDPAILKKIDRQALTAWFSSLRGLDGSFSMHTGGERDVRASFCVMVASTLLDLPLNEIAPQPLCANYIASCQTYEGGITNSDVGTEAHGGYTQCALAALVLMKEFDVLDTHSLKRWIAARQFRHEGGFNGRTNKLVDSCYSFWIGSSAASLRIAEAYKKFKTKERLTVHDLLILDYGQLVDVQGVSLEAASIEEFEEDVKATEAKIRVARYEMLQEELRQRKESSEKLAAVVEGGEGATHSNKVLEGSDAENSSDFEDIKEEVKVAASESVHTARMEAMFEAQRARRPIVSEGDDVDDDRCEGDFIFNQLALQNYVMRCCQDDRYGGLMDKPGHPNDFYHTCYALSGCSVSFNNLYSPNTASDVMSLAVERGWLPPSAVSRSPAHPDGTVPSPLVLDDNRAMVVRATNPVINICKERVLNALRTFAGKTFI